MMHWASSVTRRCFLWLTGGLLTRPWLTRCTTAPSAGEGLGPEEILARMVDVYAHCASYRDSGCVEKRFLTIEGEPDFVSRRPFSTAFVRPDRFRFEFTSQKDYRAEPERYIVYARQEEVWTWWNVTPGEERIESLGLALAGATGVSGGSAHTIPVLLMPDRIEGRKLTELAELRRLEDVELDGVGCYRIQGRFVDPAENDPVQKERMRRDVLRLTGRVPEEAVHGPQVVWIEQGTFLVRRIEERTRFSTFQTEEVTTYEPRIEERLTDQQLRFDPPTRSGA
jgi:hypothetical protein